MEGVAMKFLLPKLSLIVLFFLLSACGGGSDGSATTKPPPPANTIPTISGIPSDLINIGSEYNFTPTAQDADSDTLTFSVDNKPTWLQFDSSTGQLQGTPTEQDAQNYSLIKITVTDSKGGTASLPEFDLLVNSAPVVSITAQSFYLEGQDVTITAINSSDVDGHDFSYAWQQIDGPSVDIDSASQSSISFLVPLIELSENVNFSLTLTDAFGAVSVETFTFAISPDEIAPTVSDFVLLNSAEPTEATLAWLPAIDNASPGYKIQYQLHASEIEFFTPGPTTLVDSYLGETSANVTGLTAGTLYYFKLLVTDAAGNEALQNNYADLTTVSLSAVRTTAEVNEAIALNLGSLEISGSNNETFTFIVNQNTVQPVIGSFLIGEDKDGEGYIREVVSVTDNQTTLVIETSPASLSDVVETGAISSKIHLRSVAAQQGVTSKLRSLQSASFNANKTAPILTWKDQLLSIKEIGALPQISNFSSKQQNKVSKNRQGLKSIPIEINPSPELTLTGEFFFEPVVKSDIEWSFGTIESYEAEVSGNFVFDGSIEFSFDSSGVIEKEMEVFSRIFKSKYIIGGVPVYQETTLSLSANFTAEAKTAINASVDNHFSTSVSFKTVYENGIWTDTTNSNFDKSITVTAEVQGSVIAEVRLIPEIKLRFYKVASIAMSVEPFLSGEIAAQVVTQIDLINEGTLSEYSFTKFDSFIGVDVNFYTDLTIFSKTFARYPNSGTKNLYTKNWQLFGLPILEITTEGPPSIYSPIIFDGKATAFINEFGTTNPIDESSLRWATFPGNANGAGTKFNWTPDKHGEIYRTYFIGNSEKLGDIGQQFLIKEIDMRDSDADGMPNAWEDFYGFNTESSTDAGDDFDLDGISNLEEYIASTNPKVKESSSEICLASIVDNTRVLDSNIGEYLGLPGAYTLSSYDTTVSYFTPLQSSDGTWTGYLSRAEGYNNGVIEVSNNYQTINYENCNYSLLQKQTTFESDGTKLEEPYVAHQNPNVLSWGEWIAVKEGAAIFYYASGEINTETPYVAKLHSDGYWQGVIEGDVISYYESGVILRESPRIGKQQNNGVWSSFIMGNDKWYYENGIVRNLVPYEVKENTDGSWISIIVGNYVQKFDTGVTDIIQPFVAKQDSDGFWQDINEGTTKQYYESSAIKIETPDVARQNDNGRWVTAVNGTGKYYYENGVVNQSTPFVAKLSDGNWLTIVEGTIVKKFETDVILSEEPYVAKQDPDGSWAALYEGIVKIYHPSGRLASEDPYVTLQEGAEGYWQSIIVGTSKLYYDTGVSASAPEFESILVAKQLNTGWWISVADGFQTAYHPNGNPSYTVLFVATKQPNQYEFWVGLRQGFQNGYYPTGTLSSTVPYIITMVDGFWADLVHGLATYYYEDGSTIIKTFSYRNGLLHGLQTFNRADGTKLRTVEYNDGVEGQTCTYDEMEALIGCS
jgi:antitoxin component YwqK of YwqJK toxin-antitoxin module